MSKSKKSKYGSKQAPHQARIDELLDLLERDSLPSLTDGEVKALSERLVANRQPEGLASLYPATVGKSQRKLVNQALYRLKQRGIEVPEVKHRPKPIEIGTKADQTDQPVLFSRPDLNGERLVYFPHSVGRRYLFVQAGLLSKDGLALLQAKESTRSDYRAVIKALTGDVTPQAPSGWMITDEAILERKLWEIGTYVRTGRMGPQVDRDLCSLLRWPQQPPPHPITEVDLNGVEQAEDIAVFQSIEVSRAFADETLFDRLQHDLDEAERGVLVLNDRQIDAFQYDIVQQTVDRLIESWSLDTLTEVILDTAFFQWLTDHSPLAKRLRGVVTAPDDEQREIQVRRFMTGFLDALFLKKTVGSDDTERRSPGGIILPS